MADIYESAFSRVFMQRFGSGPTVLPVYQGFWKAGAVSWGQGDSTSIKVPDSSQYGQFVRVGKIPGEPDDPTLAITARYTMDISDLLKLAKDGCDHTVHVHMGRCGDVKDFNRGWEKIAILEKARLTTYGTDDLGALEPSERAVVNEDVSFTGEDYYEIKPLTFSENAAVQITGEVVGLVVCDAKSCGFCGLPSDGCSVVFAATKSSGGSPGLPAEVVFTENGGSDWGQSSISTLETDDPSDLSCVGVYIVVVSNASGSLHYAEINDLLQGIESWTEVSTGFAGSGAPNKIFSLGPSYSWVVGDGGYIYFTSDPTGGVAAQSSGGATVENLHDIHGIDIANLVAVGANNAVVYTHDGGSVWQAVTGPAVGVDLNCVFMRSTTEWWVGTANGKMYYTRNSGATWTEKTFSGSGSGDVRDIKFTTPSVGYMAHEARVFRTLDGGYSWYVLPEGVGTIPANDAINRLATCANANILYAAGLGDNAVDGILVKAS